MKTKKMKTEKEPLTKSIEELTNTYLQMGESLAQLRQNYHRNDLPKGALHFQLFHFNHLVAQISDQSLKTFDVIPF